MHPPQFVVFVLVIEASSDFTRSDRMSMQALPSNHRVNSSNGFKVLFTLSLSTSSLSLPLPPGPNISLDLNISPSFSPSPFANDTEVLFRVFYILTSLSPPLVFLLVRKTIENKGGNEKKKILCVVCFSTTQVYILLQHTSLLSLSGYQLRRFVYTELYVSLRGQKVQIIWP